jgi:hypothetical protein
VKQKSGRIEGLPTTLLYDRQGIIPKKIIGFEYADFIESELKALL